MDSRELKVLFLVMRWILLAIVGYLFSACNNEHNRERQIPDNLVHNLPSLKRSVHQQALFFDSLSLDSAALNNNFLQLYFIDENITWNPTVSKQVIEWTLKPLKHVANLRIDSIEYNFIMPNREAGNVMGTKLKAGVAQYVFGLYNDSLTSRLIDSVMWSNYRLKSDSYLEELNVQLAYAWYGVNFGDSAFFGVDALSIIAAAIENCKKGTTQNVELQLIQKIIQSKLDSTYFHYHLKTKNLLTPIVDSCLKWHSLTSLKP